VLPRLSVATMSLSMSRSCRARSDSGQPVAGPGREDRAAICLRHDSYAVSGRCRELGKLLGDAAEFADRGAVSGWLVGCLQVGLSAGVFVGRLMSRGGWEARAIASGPVGPSSAAQPSMCGQSRWPSCRSPSPARSARRIAVRTLLGSRTS
jgi:hypothetical protein